MTKSEIRKLAEATTHFVAFGTSEQTAKISGESIIAPLDEIERLREALVDLFALMDEHLLVRDISKDSEPNFHMRTIRFVERLAKARAALIDSREDEV